jgi:nucleotide-binding universal stress UspA family protein
LLVAIDFSADSLAALASVREMARRLGGELVLLHVSEAADVVPGSDIAKHDRAHWQAELDAEVAQLHAAGLRARAVVRPGYPVDEAIVEAAREERADIIVMGSPGRSGLAERLLGSVTDAVIGSAACPVLVMCRPRPDAG